MPAKVTDSRYEEYRKQYGDESWELDALEPMVITDIIQRAVLQYRDQQLWDEAQTLEDRGKLTVRSILSYFPDVVKFLRRRRQHDGSGVVCSGCGATEDSPICQCDSATRGIVL